MTRLGDLVAVGIPDSDHRAFETAPKLGENLPLHADFLPSDVWHPSRDMGQSECAQLYREFFAELETAQNETRQKRAASRSRNNRLT